MKTQTTMTNDFQPILMHTNNAAISSTLKNAEGLAAKWNNAIEATGKLLKKELSNEDKAEILKNRLDAVMAQLRDGFQFKNASDDFNIQSLGINLNPVKEAFRQLGKFDSDILELENGFVRISEKGKNRIAQSACLYTKTEKQNEVYKMAQRLSANLNEALEKNIISKLDRPGLEQTFKIITQPMGADGFEPDFTVIARM